jgi:hypothetical protein
VTPGDDPHLAAFRLHLRKQRCLLLRRPLTAALNPRNDLYICQSGLHLELPKATPADANLGHSGRDFYTQLTGRLQISADGRDLTVTEIGIENNVPPKFSFAWHVPETRIRRKSLV